MTHLVSLVEELLHRGVGFLSIQNWHIDTTTAAGELMVHVFSSLAQFERRLTQERTAVDLTGARARGRLGGRRPVTGADLRVAAAKRLHQDRNPEINDIRQTLRSSRSTFYCYLGIT